MNRGSFEHTPASHSHRSSRPFQLGNLPSLFYDNEAPVPRDPHPVNEPSPDPPIESQGDGASEVDTSDPRVSAPQTPVKVFTIGDATSAASRSRRDPSPRRIVLTRPKRTIPTLKTIQSPPVVTLSPVASSTPAKPPAGEVVEESPLLGKRRRGRTDATPAKSTKPKSKGKEKAVDLGPVHTSPIESPRFDTSAPTRTSKRPRESGGSPGPQPERKILRSGAIPTSPINSAVFPPNPELPSILSRQGSLTVSSDQLFKKSRDDRVIKIKSRLPPPAEAFVADTSVIESFDTSPSKPPTTAKQASAVDNGKKPQANVKTAVTETSFLTSPGTSPEKQPAFLPPQTRGIAADPTFADLSSPENSREAPAPNPKDAAELKPSLPGRTAKTMGITKLRPAATTIPHTEAGPSKVPSSTMPLRSRSTLGKVQPKKNPIITTKKGKDKPAKMTPVEYAEMLIEKYSNPNRKIPNLSQHLRGRKIFYVGVDMRYAGDGTKKKMEYVRTRTTPNLAPVAHSAAPDSQARGNTCP
jgi:hypothetical protein